MATSYLSETIKGSDYITPYDQDVVHKAFLYQQQQFDSNVQKVQEGIDKLSSIDVIAGEDKQYRDSLIQGLTQKANSIAGMDFSKSSTMNIINQAKRAITSDDRLLGAVQDTAQIRKKQAHQSELIKKGQYSDANMWEDAQADIAYLTAKKVDPNARYKGSSFATPYKDISKALEKTSLNVAKLKAQGHKQIPMTRNIINADGSVTQTHDMIDISGISDQELSAYIMQTLPVSEQKQLGIDARYKYRASTPEALLAEGTASITQKYVGMKNRLEQLDRAAKQTVKGSAEEKRITDEQASLNKVYQEQVKNGLARLNTLISTDPDKVKVMLHENMLAGTYGALYSNLSEKITEDKPYYREAAQNLNESKFQFQQLVQSEQIRQGQQKLLMDAERVRQGDERLDIQRAQLALKSEDVAADNARADAKQNANINGTTSSGINKGTLTPSTSGIEGSVTTKPIIQSYTKFKEEGIALKEQEMSTVLSAIVDIAHDQDSAIFQNKELMKYLGVGKDNKINITDATGKINPQVADKLGKYFDKIGLSGIMPKMQRYYEEIARGGNPDTFATFKEYMPLANSLNILKDKQKAHAAQDKVITDGAIELLHKEVGSKLPIPNFALNVKFIERITNKIGAYEPSATEKAKYAHLGSSATKPDEYIHAPAINRLLLLDPISRDLTVDGAKKLGITEKQRVEYNKTKNQYDRDLLNQLNSAKEEYANTSGTGFSTVKQFTVTDAESKSDTNTSSLLRNTIVSNPNLANVIPTGEEAPLVATDPRIANITNVKVLEHNVDRTNGSTARVEISYESTDKEGKSKTQKYIANTNLSNEILDNSQFRRGFARREPYQDIIDTIDINGGRSSEQYVNYQSEGVSNPDPIAFVFERSPNDPKDNNMYLRVVVKDSKGNDTGFKFGGRNIPSKLVEYLYSTLDKSMSQGLTKQQAIDSLRKIGNR